MGILVRELSALYAAFAAGESSPLPELMVQYGDFSQWQREQLASGALHEQAEYWKKQLAGIAPVTLITDRPRPAQADFEGGVEAFTIPRAVANRVKALASEEDATLFMALLTAFAALLQRYTRQEDIVIGTPIANRRREVEPLIGFFVNSLVLRTDLSGGPSFRELLGRVRRTALKAFMHQDLPFDKLVQELLPERDPGQNPLFQIMFSVEEPGSAVLELTGLALAPLEIGSAVAKFDLTVNLEETAGGLAGAITYRTALFNADTVARMAVHFTRLLSSASAFPDRPLRGLSLLDETERALVVKEWNATARDYPRCGIAALFAEQARSRPEAVAVVCGAEKLTYGALDRRAGQLAAALRRRGIWARDAGGHLRGTVDRAGRRTGGDFEGRRRLRGARSELSARADRSDDRRCEPAGGAGAEAVRGPAASEVRRRRALAR